MSAPVDVLAVLNYLASHDWDGDARPGNAAVDSAIGAVADLIDALDGLEQAYCRAGSPLDRAERTEDRKRLIAARASLARFKGGAV